MGPRKLQPYPSHHDDMRPSQDMRMDLAHFPLTATNPSALKRGIVTWGGRQPSQTTLFGVGLSACAQGLEKVPCGAAFSCPRGKGPKWLSFETMCVVQRLPVNVCNQAPLGLDKRLRLSWGSILQISSRAFSGTQHCDQDAGASLGCGPRSHAAS